jgi:tetratricopeptide (TPR) repeat protein
MVQALEMKERALTELATFAPPVGVLQNQLLDLELWVYAGRTAEAEGLLESLAAQLQPPQDALVPLGRMALHEALEQPHELEAALAESREMLERTGMNVLEGAVVYFTGRLAEMRGDWEAALAAYEEERATRPTDGTIPAQLGRCYREMGDLERAESLIQETLRIIPSHGRSHYELALVYERMGRRDDAIRHLEQSLATWAPADAEFRWAALAREKLAGL